MSLSDFLVMLLSLVAIAAVLYGSYRFSKYMSNRVNGISSSSNVKIHERALLGQDKGLAVVEICDKFYLIGFSNTNIDILKELDDYRPEQKGNSQYNFMNTLKTSMKNFNGSKPGGKDDE